MGVRTLSPLRYPGGKSCLTRYMKALIKQNSLEVAHILSLLQVVLDWH